MLFERAQTPAQLGRGFLLARSFTLVLPPIQGGARAPWRRLALLLVAHLVRIRCRGRCWRWQSRRAWRGHTRSSLEPPWPGESDLGSLEAIPGVRLLGLAGILA